MKVAVIIPCLNESETIASVVSEFRRYLPDASINVFDNNSDDVTAEIAKQSGAEVFSVAEAGKGNVLSYAFRVIDADYFIMIDGDNTYPVNACVRMLQMAIDERADMVIGSRTKSYASSQSRLGHEFGNRLLTKSVNLLFDSEINDLLSGYRVLSRRFVKSFPVFSKGFEIETDMSIHAAEMGVKVLECDVEYGARVEGSESKLNTCRDGIKIGLKILDLYKDIKPMKFFSLLSLFFLVVGLLVGAPVIYEFIETRYVAKVPSAILATGLVLISVIFLLSGIIVSGISKSRREAKRLAYLAVE